MSDKLQSAREHILRKIEDGILCGGSKLPAAREYAEELGVSLAIMQMAFTSLTRDGILSSVPRQGTYVREDWMERILPGSFQTFRPVWKQVLSELIARDVPGGGCATNSGTACTRSPRRGPRSSGRRSISI